MIIKQLGRGVSETIIANGADADAALLAGIGVPSRTSILGSGQMTGHSERAARNGPPRERHPSSVRVADQPDNSNAARPYFFSSACQFKTTVSGDAPAAAVVAGRNTRKRWPSALAS